MNWLAHLRRRYLLGRAPAGPLRALLSEPWPETSRDARNTPLLAIDFETTGMDAKRDALVSAAWVPIDAGRIDLSRASRWIIRPPDGSLTSDSIHVHGIGHDRAANGTEIEPLLEELLGALRTRVVVAHHAPLDLAFLSAACKRTYGAPLAWPCIDTLELLRTHLALSQSVPAPALHLGAGRAHFGLPAYPGHDALWDAVAAAELWLALAAEWAGQRPLPLGRICRVLPG
jgi:DNA polymerase-3 subunit epsilon